MKRRILLFAVISLILASCFDNETLKPKTQLNDEIQEVRDWFETNHFSNKGSENTRAKAALLGTPRWEEALTNNAKTTKIIEIPLDLFNPDLTASLSTDSDKFISTRLVIFGQNDSYQAAVLQIVPADEFASFYKNDLAKISLRSLVKFFSGVIHFYEWGTNSLIESYLLEKGEIKGKSNSKSSAYSRTECYEVTTYYYTSVCSEYGCSYHFDYSTTSTYCSYTPDQNVYDQSLEPADPYGGGFGGGSENSGFEEPSEAGIDCNSFNFTKTTTDAHWQEAAVYNITFKVRFYAYPSNTVTYREVTISRPLWFGVPTQLYEGRTFMEAVLPL